MTVAVTVAALALVPACGVGLSTGSPDGSDADGAPDSDAARERPQATIRPPNCFVGSTICVEKAVHACAAQQAGAWLEDCDEACSFGRCTTTACKDAEENDAVHGCRFYAVQVDNVDGDDGADMMLVLTNSSSKVAADVLVEVRSATGDWEPQLTEVVPAEGSALMVRNRPIRDPGTTRGGALRISSGAPILAAQIVSDDANHGSTSSGGTILLPVHALANEYLAVTDEHRTSSQVTAAPGSRSGAGTIVIVGTVDHTTVHLVPTGTALVSPVAGPGSTIPKGIQYDIFLDEGDVEQIFSAELGVDLSGSEITADHPVEVLSGNTFTSYGNEMSGLNGADLAIEQVPPKNRWGTKYVGAWLTPQTGCDPYFMVGRGSWQVIASEDDTNVALMPAPRTAFDPAATTFRLDRGGSRRFLSYTDRTGLLLGVPSPPPDFVVEANHPILLAQWLDCEAGLSFGVDTQFGPGETIVAFPPGFDHQLVLVRAAGTPVSIDGLQLPDGVFQPASGARDFQVARFAERDLPACIDLSDGCHHRITGDAVGVTLRGMDVVCSYSLTVPSSYSCLLPGVGCPE